MSRDDIFSLTYPQFLSVMRSLKTEEAEAKSRNATEFMSEIGSGQLNTLISEWRKEKEDADN